MHLLNPRLLLLTLSLPFLTPSCADNNEELQQRLDRRNESYGQLQERRKMRGEARDERYDAWWDRTMH